MTPLIDHLLKMRPQTIVSFDELAVKACRDNLEKQMDSAKFDKGGNITEYQSMNIKEIDATDETRVTWEGTAQELIIALLVEGF